MAKHRAARRRSWRRAALLALVAGCLALVAIGIGSAVSFLQDGGRLFVVRTPSMGTTAPVGTMVLTRPTAVDALRVGDIVAFHPPTRPAETFTHRVVAIGRDGAKTRGDVNGSSDPWTLTDKDLVGRTVVLAPGVGWLLRAAPYLAGGALLVWLLTRLWISPARRGPARLFGAAVVFLVAVQVLQPFVGVSQLAAGTDAKGATTVAAVSTGLLPIRLTPAPGNGHAEPLDLVGAGHSGVSALTGGRPGSQFHLDAALHLSGAQWIFVVLLCASPLLWTLLVGFRNPGDVGDTDDTEPRGSRAGRVAVAVPA